MTRPSRMVLAVFGPDGLGIGVWKAAASQNSRPQAQAVGVA